MMINNRIILMAAFLFLSIACFAQSEKEMLDNLKEKKIGFAILRAPINNLKIDLSTSKMVIEEVKGAHVFTKKMQYYGISFVAMKEVPDEFIYKVGLALEEIFSQNENLDLKKQNELINAMRNYNACIPVIYGHHDEITRATEEEMMEYEMGDYSVCDVIMYGGRGQTMEVVEHLLHHISDVGLHYIYPKDWSLDNVNSTVSKSMAIAIEKGFFNVKDYKELAEEDMELYQRILIQEYAYWIISTYWNLQEKYGPNEPEWRIKNKVELKEKLPMAYELIYSTVAKIMRAPSETTLKSFTVHQ